MSRGTMIERGVAAFQANRRKAAREENEVVNNDFLRYIPADAGIHLPMSAKTSKIMQINAHVHFVGILTAVTNTVSFIFPGTLSSFWEEKTLNYEEYMRGFLGLQFIGGIIAAFICVNFCVTFPRKHLFSIALIFTFLSMGLQFKEDISFILISKLFGGFGMGMQTIGATYYYTECVLPENRAHAFTIGTLYSLISTPVVLLLGMALEWKTLLGVVGMGFLSYIAILLMIPETPYACLFKKDYRNAWDAVRGMVGTEIPEIAKEYDRICVEATAALKAKKEKQGSIYIETSPSFQVIHLQSIQPMIGVPHYAYYLTKMMGILEIKIVPPEMIPFLIYLIILKTFRPGSWLVRGEMRDTILYCIENIGGLWVGLGTLFFLKYYFYSNMYIDILSVLGIYLIFLFYYCGLITVWDNSIDLFLTYQEKLLTIPHLIGLRFLIHLCFSLAMFPFSLFEFGFSCLLLGTFSMFMIRTSTKKLETFRF